MKRRNAEYGKLRRPIKRNKITDGIYGSTLLYLKFLVVWGVVLLADFILEFRFEFLFPFWLLLRTAYDSFKYHGLAFCIFFIFIAVTSDMLCFFFIPVHWLFFAASTYVWVQYVWHTDRGICLPTVILWFLFVYVEAAVRLRDIKHLPFHLDLCRPFAAHCIGYPVVTLGFGFKSYIGFRMRQRRQKEVAKENEFYVQLLRQALPLEQHDPHHHLLPHQHLLQQQRHQTCQNPCHEKNKGHTSQNESAMCNGIVHNGTSHSHTSSAKNNHRKCLDKGERDKSMEQDSKLTAEKSHKYSSCIPADLDYIERVGVKSLDRSPGTTRKSGGSNFMFKRSVNDFDVNEVEKDKSAKISVQSLKTNSSSKWSSNQSRENAQRERKNKVNRDVNRDNAEGSVSCKDEYYARLEADVRRFKVDLQLSRQVEQELRSQINTLVSGEQSVKNELSQLQQDNDNLQSKLHGLVTARQSDKQTISQLERRLQEERRLRGSFEAQLTAERKAKKAEEAVAARAVAMAAVSNKNECTESCRARRRDLEAEGKQLRRELKLKDERYLAAEREMQALRQYKETHNESEILMSALSAMQDKNAHLENSLSAETRIKLDLFSALGEAKRQLEIRENVIRAQEKEIEQLKSKIAQVLAIMPTDSFGPEQPSCPGTSKLCIIETQNACVTCNVSNLDPNATAYTPKNSLIASTKG